VRLQFFEGDFFIDWRAKMSNKRRFSLEGDFMNYNTDDLLFGAMYHLSTYHPVEKKLYLSKKNLLKNKKTIYELCDLDA
jgi:hypothetical protein